VRGGGRERCEGVMGGMGKAGETWNGRRESDGSRIGGGGGRGEEDGGHAGEGVARGSADIPSEWVDQLQCGSHPGERRRRAANLMQRGKTFVLFWTG